MLTTTSEGPVAWTLDECHDHVIPFMADRGFVFESGRHNSRSEDLEDGGAGWYAVFFRDDRETCFLCDNPRLTWEDAEHGADYVDVVNRAARRALREAESVSESEESHA